MINTGGACIMAQDYAARKIE